MKELGYYEVKINGTRTDCYCIERTSEESHGMTLECACCGKIINKWISCNYIDENDNELEEIYGATCFKKIAIKDKSVREF